MTEESKRAVVASNIVGSELDNSAKKLFNYKEIIAPILQFTVPEFKGYSVEEIIKMIDADSISDDVPVEDLPQEIIDRGTEMPAFTEKPIRYDKHFLVKNPVLSDENIRVMLHFDYEVQNNYKPSDPSYEIVSRAMYYAARELSSQLGPLKENTDYGQLEKAYSIWVCNTNVPVKLRNTVSIYSMKKEDLIGSSESESDRYYDLMSVIIIRRGKENEYSKEQIFDYLSGVFKGDITKIEKYTDTDSDPEIRKEVSEMSGIGESLVIDARLDDLQRLVIAGKIGSVDEAKDFYPSLEEDDIQEIFNSLHNNSSNQN